MSTLPTHVSGFAVIQVAYAHSMHVLYARAHRSKPQDTVYPQGRTLFLVNVPVDATDREVALFFRHCGMVERVVYDRDPSREDATAADEGPDADTDADADADTDAQSSQSPPPSPTSKGPQARSKKGKREPKETPSPRVVPLPPLPTRTFRKTGGIAHVVFLDASSLDKVLVPSQWTTPRPWPSSEEPRGLAHYAALYDAQRPPLDVVKAHADTWMERFEFDLVKTRQKSAYRKGEAIVDEDGFTLVTRGGAYGQTLGGGVAVASKTFEKTGRTGSKKKKEPKEKGTFYAFQKAEKQRKALLDLRKNFEADKARIEKLKESRRFKPY